MSQSEPVSRPRFALVEWPLILALALPLLLLAGLAGGLLAQAAAQAALDRQAQALAFAVSQHFAEPRSWQDEKRFSEALQKLPWRQAYLEDHDGARVWQRDRHLTAPDWPHPSPLRFSLDSSTDLILVPGTLPAGTQAALRRQLMLSGLALLLLSLGLTLAGYMLARRPWLAVLRWALAVEAGELTRSPPTARGLSGAIASSLAVLAQRLRFSRDALQQHVDQADQRIRVQQQEAQREIRDLRTEIERTRENLASRSALTSGVSHELRTPLTAILGFSDLLDKGELSTEQREFVQTIRKSAKGLVGMINDLLDMERIDAGRLELHEVAFDINDVVEDTLSLLAPLAYEKELDLIRIVDHDVPDKLLGDAARLQQILTNLVSNAIKFTDQGEVLVHVSRQADEADCLWVRIEVEDSGIGLSKEDQARLFTAYQRFAEDLPGHSVGSGLGLTIVKRLSELLNGRIDVRSMAGKGSVFSVTLPLQEQAEPRQKPAWDALRGRRIWVLEAQDKGWRALQHLLAFWQVDSRRFLSAPEMLRTLQSLSPERRPDLMLLCLPARECSELPARNLLEHARQEQLPAGCLVNSVDGNLHRRLKDLGASKVIPKCCDRSSLFRCCCELLSDSDNRPEQALQGVAVLVAENNAASRHYLRALLDSLGADVHLVEDGAQAVARLRALSPRFLLLDQNMPGMSGIEATQAIRQLEQARETVIIGMPAFLGPEQEQRWLDAGLDALLPKPFDENQLLRCLHPWLRGRERIQPGSDKPQLAQQLLDDPELSLMIIEELPRQLEQLDEAYIAGTLQACRDAAHQLHGTAAFYHLEPLKSHVQRLERRLNDIDDIARYPWLRDDMADVAAAARELTEMLKRRRHSAAQQRT